MNVLSKLVLLRRGRTWMEILLIGVLAATAISLWPTAQCALGACRPADQWCNGDCSQTCGFTNGLREIDPANGGWGTVAQGEKGLYCLRKPNGFRTIGYRCDPTASNCNATWIEDNRTIIHRNGNTYAMQLDVRPPQGGIPGETKCVPRIRMVQLQCCSGAAGGGGGNVCTPEYDPPTITLAGHTPPYPLTIGQDPDDLGVDVTVSIAGGQKNNGCSSGPPQRTVTAAVLRGVRLSDATIQWIEGELAAYYHGAHVKDRYPLRPYYVTSGMGSTQATLTFHFDPLDPGDYEIVVNATQDDGQTQETTLSLHVWLMEATITR